MFRAITDPIPNAFTIRHVEFFIFTFSKEYIRICEFFLVPVGQVLAVKLIFFVVPYIFGRVGRLVVIKTDSLSLARRLDIIFYLKNMFFSNE